MLEFSAAFQAIQDSSLLRAQGIAAPDEPETLAGPDLSKAAQAAAAALASVRKALGKQPLHTSQQGMPQFSCNISINPPWPTRS